MSPQTPPPGTFITQQEFNTYSAAWSEAISSGHNLPEIFQRTGQARLTYVKFSLQTIVWLLSTVGARSVKAQFLLKPDADLKQSHFTLALYATDALNGRISAYYLADNQTSSDQPPFNDQIPHDLVKAWLQNWTAAKQVTPAMFASSYGPMEGYSFDIADFMDPLFAARTYDNKEMHIGFGLHEHYPASGTELKQTFGLVIRIYKTTQTAARVQDDPSDEPFFDLSHPFPPGG
ncbi:hypothetical protein [Hymenobacter sp. BRD67]|uniref:hypothetical protein n=1 Tax=Hymenobacter sp. BRD67 TaxID=2675877 RepID=UPI001567C19B|nr:hypothetical protein [Hymenobacter sp. BRD67]QKG54328.1 hypothetical protein GKZ67_19140 [Hymenobacter sp. BRD67]